MFHSMGPTSRPRWWSGTWRLSPLTRRVGTPGSTGRRSAVWWQARGRRAVVSLFPFVFLFSLGVWLSRFCLDEASFSNGECLKMGSE